MKPIRNRPRLAPKTPLKVSSSSGSDSDKKIQDPVEVFCRLKPRTDYQDESCITVSSPTTLTLVSPDFLKNRKAVQYTFNHIFQEYVDQKEVFDHIGMPLLRGLVQGKDGLLFTYGVTGSGKTYTMTGERNNPGITPRCIDTLFNTITDCQIPKFTVKSDKMNGFEIQSDVDALGDRMQEVKQKRRVVKKSSSDSDLLSYSNDGTTISNINENSLYAVFISYVEIYNNIAYDLLDENVATKSLQAKILREDSNHNVYVNGVVEVEVKTSAEALELYSMGKKRKRMAQTSLNSESSRSHSVFTIRVVTIPADIQSEIVKDRNLFTAAQLSLVDLAGSERCGRSQTSGQRLKEAGSINNSLMSLRTCLEVLRENQITGTYRIVPYRESRLTHLFKKFFEGEGKVEMIVCVNPSVKDYDETVHVMKFAEMTQDVKVSRPDVKKIETDGIPRRLVERKVSRNDDVPSLVSIGVQTNFESPEKLYRSPIERMPQVRLIDPDSDEIKELILYLKRRRHYLRKFKVISKLSSNFRVRLSELQNTECNYRNQITHVIPAHKEEVKNLKRKISDMEHRTYEVEEKCVEQDEIVENYQRMLEETNFKLRQNMKEKVKQKRFFEEKITHELDAKLRKQRDVLKSAMKNDLEKIELVKDILTDKIPISGIAIESTANIQNDDRNENEVDENQFKHVPRREAPVANVRYRRSRSAGDRWLEHRPANPTPLGTVLQPVFRCHKSVQKLTNMKDVVNPKQSKYLLISQGQDDVGDLETKLYKGDIIPTCTGGAQVIFDDVEKLKQESPTRKNNLKRGNQNGNEGDDKKPRRQ